MNTVRTIDIKRVNPEHYTISSFSEKRAGTHYNLTWDSILGRWRCDCYNATHQGNIRCKHLQLFLPWFRRQKAEALLKQAVTTQAQETPAPAPTTDTGMLEKAIQELQKQIDALADENKALRSELEDIKSELEQSTEDNRQLVQIMTLKMRNETTRQVGEANNLTEKRFHELAGRLLVVDNRAENAQRLVYRMEKTIDESPELQLARSIARMLEGKLATQVTTSPIIQEKIVVSGKLTGCIVNGYRVNVIDCMAVSCNCPDGQRPSYCKHGRAVDEMLRDM